MAAEVILRVNYSQGWVRSRTDEQIANKRCQNRVIQMVEFVFERVPLICWLLSGILGGLVMSAKLDLLRHLTDKINHQNRYYYFYHSHRRYYDYLNLLHPGLNDWVRSLQAWDREWYESGTSMTISVQLSEPMTKSDNRRNQLYSMDIIDVLSAFNHIPHAPDQSAPNTLFEPIGIYHSNQQYYYAYSIYVEREPDSDERMSDGSNDENRTSEESSNDESNESKKAELSEGLSLASLYHSYLSHNVLSASYDGFYSLFRHINLLHRLAEPLQCVAKPSDYNGTAHWMSDCTQPLRDHRLGQVSAVAYHIQCPNQFVLSMFWNQYRRELGRDWESLSQQG